MAVIDEVPGLKVEIVNPYLEPFREYGGDGLQPAAGEEDKLQTCEITRYIEARSGSKFGVRAIFDSAFISDYGVLVHLVIDGRSATTLAVKPGRVRVQEGHLLFDMHEFEHNKVYRRDFQFTELEIGK